MIEVREVIKGLRTSEDTEDTILAGVDFARSVGKEPIGVESLDGRPDRAGMSITRMEGERKSR
jgi:3-hydroxyacyl-CoA dehydrogenase